MPRINRKLCTASKIVICDFRVTQRCRLSRFLDLRFCSLRRAQSKRGGVFTSFLPGVSKEALTRMRQEVRGWALHRQTSLKLADLCTCNAIARHEWVVDRILWRRFYSSALRPLTYHIDAKA